jgi:hypothetical protein
MTGLWRQKIAQRAIYPFTSGGFGGYWAFALSIKTTSKHPLLSF